MCQAENNNWCWKVIYYSSEWKEILIFANDETSKGFVSKIYEWFMWLNIQKTNNLIKKWVEDLNRCTDERCSTS